MPSAQDLHEAKDSLPAFLTLRKVTQKQMFHLGTEFLPTQFIADEIEKHLHAIRFFRSVHTCSPAHAGFDRADADPSSQVSFSIPFMNSKNAVRGNSATGNLQNVKKIRRRIVRAGGSG